MKENGDRNVLLAKRVGHQQEEIHTTLEGSLND